MDFNFKTDKQALEFLARFTSSEMWKWMEMVLKARQEAIIQELSNARTTADGRSMLNGKLIEIHRMLEFPVKSFDFYRANKEMREQAEKDAAMTENDKAAMVAKTAFPDVTTH